ncbi:hypothetical protein GQ457_09G014010 [Hibiscus cannabinus]
MTPRQKVGPDASKKKTDAWILGSTRNPEMYILKDKGTRCHQRYLDLMLNLEVETPMMSMIAGGGPA